MKELRPVRRSGRLDLEVPVRVTGLDQDGNPFTEDTHTLTVSRFGGRVALAHPVIPEQNLWLRHLERGTEDVARIAWHRPHLKGGYECGIEFRGRENFWGIDFVLHDSMERTLPTFLLECTRCHARRVFELDAYDEKTLQLDGLVSRPCQRCQSVERWQLPE